MDDVAWMKCDQKKVWVKYIYGKKRYFYLIHLTLKLYRTAVAQWLCIASDNKEKLFLS